MSSDDSTLINSSIFMNGANLLFIEEQPVCGFCILVIFYLTNPVENRGIFGLGCTVLSIFNKTLDSSVHSSLRAPEGVSTADLITLVTQVRTLGGLWKLVLISVFILCPGRSH